MTKVNFNVPVCDKNGKPFGYETPCLIVNDKLEIIYDEKGVPRQGYVTDEVIQRLMIDVALDSLIWENPQVPILPKERMERYYLFKKIQSKKKKGSLIIELEHDELTLLREVTKACQTTLILGQFIDLLDGKNDFGLEESENKTAE